MAKYGINKVVLIGNLGADPEIRTISDGVSVANFSLATTERSRDKNGQTIDKTEWHYIVMWRGLAETAHKYLRKGSTVYLEGKLQTRNWDDENGKKHYRTEIVANNMVMLDGPRTGAESNLTATNYSTPNNNTFGGNDDMASDSEEDDLPF